MVLLYGIVCRVPGTRLKGTYLPSAGETGEKGGSAPSAVGAQSATFKSLVKGFEVLETDFKRIDLNRNGTLVFEELLSEVSVIGSASARIDFISRLQAAFHRVDMDGSKGLDFYEFMLLTLHVSTDGAYSVLISKSRDPAAVKRLFLDLNAGMRKAGTSPDSTFALSQVQALCVSMFGGPVDGIEAAFGAVAASNASLPFIGLLKVLYQLAWPRGAYDPSTYKPDRRVSEHLEINQPHAASNPHPERIVSVVVTKFRPTKVLGEGGQGKVCLGTYDGVKCAGKTFTGEPDQVLVDEVKTELEFFRKLDHPNCHYLLGAKDTLDQGGILVLTEVCDKGSLFDLYYKNHVKIDQATALRFSKECAAGYGHIHSMGYMHRDIKSLNVFLTGTLVCQVTLNPKP